MKAYPKNSETFIDDIIKERLLDIREIQSLSFNAGYQTGMRKSTKVLTASAAVGTSDYNVLATSTSGDITATLQNSPQDGQEHRFVNDDGSSDDLIIDGDDNDIHGTGTLTLAPGVAAILVYFGGGTEWRIMSAS